MQCQLPISFKPGPRDVLIGRGKLPLKHPGNIRLKSIVGGFLSRYSNAKTQNQKSVIVSEVVSIVRCESPDGGFVKKKAEEDTWYEVGDHAAREKVSQTFRDFLHKKYRSSLTNKKKLQKRKNRALRMAQTEFALDMEPPVRSLLTTIPRPSGDESPSHPIQRGNDGLEERMLSYQRIIEAVTIDKLTEVNFA